MAGSPRPRFRPGLAQIGVGLVVGVSTAVSGCGGAQAEAPTESAPTDDVAAQPAASADPVRFVFPVESQSVRYDPTHHDYPAADMFADCGTPVLATTDGTIEEVATSDEWESGIDDPALRSGLLVSLVDYRGVRYYGSHLASVTVEPGARVAAGDRLGTVGDTGNAAGTGCHLHYGLSPACRTGWENRRGLTAPQPFLDDWRVGGQRDPLGAVVEVGC